MAKLTVTVTIDGENRKYDVSTDFYFVAMFDSESHRYEVLECPDNPDFTVVLKEPYNDNGKADLNKATIVYQNTHESGFRQSCLWSLNQLVNERQAVYDAIAAEQKAAREAEKAEAEATKEAARKAKEAAKKAKEKTGKPKGNGNAANGKEGATRIDVNRAAQAIKNGKNGNGKASAAKARMSAKKMTAKAKSI